jgi:DNA-directed RNA polymerase subunit RPC12/RpoP
MDPLISAYAHGGSHASSEERSSAPAVGAGFSPERPGTSGTTTGTAVFTEALSTVAAIERRRPTKRLESAADSNRSRHAATTLRSGDAMTRKCAQCGAQFTPKTSRGRFCSRTCHYAHRDGSTPRGTTITALCARCGRSFTFTSSTKRRRLCDGCHGPVAPAEPRSCDYCGASFVGRRGQRFCSAPCGDRAKSRARGRLASGSTAERFCVSCGRRFAFVVWKRPPIRCPDCRGGGGA